MQNKSTKYALISSIMATCLCIVLLAGLTFAWFSDSANTGVNIIRSGSFDLDLLDDEGNSIDKTLLDWIKKEGQTEVVWSPGCTYQLPNITIVNKGNLDLKYSIIFDGIDGNSELLDVIDFTVTVDGQEINLKDYEAVLAPNERNVLVIKGHMDENAGSEYQNMTINSLSITVKSTQIDANFKQDTTTTEQTEATTNQLAEVYRTLESAEAEPVEIKGVSNVEAKTFINVKADDKTPALSLVDLSGIKADNVIVVEKSNTALVTITLSGGSYTINEKLIVNNSATQLKVFIASPIEINGKEISTSSELADYISGPISTF